MKNLFYIILLISFTSCFINKINFRSKKRLEILKIDSTSDFYVFNIKSSSKPAIIVIAEKEKVSQCRPFKKFIIADSIQETGMIKSGSRFVLIGANEFTIDGIKVKNGGELAKVISNCNAFTDR